MRGEEYQRDLVEVAMAGRQMEGCDAVFVTGRKVFLSEPGWRHLVEGPIFCGVVDLWLGAYGGEARREADRE